MDRRAQGLSLNAIIIGLIVLIVLIIIIAVFTGYFGTFAPSVNSCSSANGECKLEVDCNTFHIREQDKRCDEAAGEICCARALGGREDPSVSEDSDRDCNPGDVRWRGCDADI